MVLSETSHESRSYVNSLLSYAWPLVNHKQVAVRLCTNDGMMIAINDLINCFWFLFKTARDSWYIIDLKICLKTSKICLVYHNMLSGSQQLCKGFQYYKACITIIYEILLLLHQGDTPPWWCVFWMPAPVQRKGFQHVYKSLVRVCVYDWVIDA